MSDAVAVGVDVGGTKLVAASLTRDGTVLDRRRRDTPTGDAEGLVAAVVELARAFGEDLPVGVGVAGIVTPEGKLVHGPNVRIDDLPLGARLAAELGRPVSVVNDVTSALHGEHRAGVARGHEHVVMVTLGTGVGGGVLAGGRLLDGAHGFAGELGHVIVCEGGRACPCGNRGCVEAYASGRALGHLARERLDATDQASSLRDADQVDGRRVARAAVEGDDLARDVLREGGQWLGVALASLVNALDPELVVIGGGASAQTAGWMLPAASSTMTARLVGRQRRDSPPLVLAQLGDDAGMVGAGLLASELDR